MIIKTEVEITPRRIADLMVTAIEGGIINYWCDSVQLVDHPFGELKKPWYDDETLYTYEPGTMGAALIKIAVVESDDDEPKTHYIGMREMEQAFLLMQEFGNPKGYCWRDFINENEDAITADVWFQLAVFGEVVYG